MPRVKCHLPLFLSTPSVRRATFLFWRRFSTWDNFYPRPP